MSDSESESVKSKNASWKLKPAQLRVLREGRKKLCTGNAVEQYRKLHPNCTESHVLGFESVCNSRKIKKSNIDMILEEVEKSEEVEDGSYKPKKHFFRNRIVDGNVNRYKFKTLNEMAFQLSGRNVEELTQTEANKKLQKKYQKNFLRHVSKRD